MGLFVPIFLALLTVAAADFVCPEPEKIAPCKCNATVDPDWGGPSAECRGAEVTQDSVTNLFKSMRSANGLSYPSYLTFDSFILSDTELDKLDMAWLMSTNLTSFNVGGNPKLSSIYASVRSSSLWTMLIKSINFDHNPLTDKAIQNFVALISAPTVTQFVINYSNLRGAPTGDMIPGLSRMTNLQTFSMQYHQMTKVSSGQFKNNKRLLDVYLDQGLISEISANAFLLPSADDDLKNASVRIGLGGNKLGDYKKIDKTAFSGIKRIWTGLFLTNSQFRYVSQDHFQKYLNANPDNYLRFDNNKINCDEKSKWLKTAPKSARFQARVMFVDCQNDPGKTIFTTTKV